MEITSSTPHPDLMPSSVKQSIQPPPQAVQPRGSVQNTLLQQTAGMIKETTTTTVEQTPAQKRPLTKFKQWSLDIFEIIDAGRLFPRVFMTMYGVLIWKLAFWFMHLDKPSMEQAGVFATITAVFAPMLNWYMQTGRKWTDD